MSYLFGQLRVSPQGGQLRASLQDRLTDATDATACLKGPTVATTGKADASICTSKLALPGSSMHPVCHLPDVGRTPQRTLTLDPSKARIKRKNQEDNLEGSNSAPGRLSGGNSRGGEERPNLASLSSRIRLFQNQKMSDKLNGGTAHLKAHLRCQCVSPCMLSSKQASVAPSAWQSGVSQLDSQTDDGASLVPGRTNSISFHVGAISYPALRALLRTAPNCKCSSKHEKSN